MSPNQELGRGPQPAESSSPKRRPVVRVSLAGFVILIGVVMIAAVAMPQQTPVQQFYLRIFAALSAAGIGAIIPGFLEFEVRWFRNMLRAGGALGLFTMIYVLNPPAIGSGAALSLEGSQEIAGSWDFVCTTQSEPFPDGGREHGGTAEIQIRRTDYLIAISITGRTEWKRDKDGNEGVINFPPDWHTQKGFFTGPDSFEYEYQTTEAIRQVGLSKLRVFTDDGIPIRLEGQFYNLPPGPPIYGTVKYTKKGTSSPGRKIEHR